MLSVLLEVGIVSLSSASPLFSETDRSFVRFFLKGPLLREGSVPVTAQVELPEAVAGWVGILFVKWICACVQSLGRSCCGNGWRLEKRQRKGTLSPAVFTVTTSCFGGCACVRRAESEIRGIKKPPHPPAGLGAFPVLKFKEALQVGVLSTARGPWLHSLVSSHHGQVSVVADLILCFIGCKVNELLFLSNINLGANSVISSSGV